MKAAREPQIERAEWLRRYRLELAEVGRDMESPEMTELAHQALVFVAQGVSAAVPCACGFYTDLRTGANRVEGVSPLATLGAVGQHGVEKCDTFAGKAKTAFRDTHRGRLVGVAARALLDAAARGSVEREDADALANEWLALTGGDLALDVLRGDDEHAATRLVELASHVLSVVDAENEGTSGT